MRRIQEQNGDQNPLLPDDIFEKLMESGFFSGCLNLIKVGYVKVNGRK